MLTALATRSFLKSCHNRLARRQGRNATIGTSIGAAGEARSDHILQRWHNILSINMDRWRAVETILSSFIFGFYLDHRDRISDALLLHNVTQYSQCPLVARAVLPIKEFYF